MPGRYKEGTVHWEESRQRWRAFVSVDGRRYSKRFLSRDEALAWTQKMRLAAHDGSFVAPSAISLGEWLIKWLGTYKKPTVKPLTYERYLFTANKALPLAEISLQKLTPTMLQELYNALTPDCAKKLHVLLHGAIQKAWELGMVRKNVVTFVKPPRVIRQEKGIFTSEELKKMMELAESDPRLKPYALFLLVAINTGMRRGELLGLRWCDVDLEERTLFIRQQVQTLSGGTLIIDTPKTAAGRRKISIPLKVYQKLKAAKAALPTIDEEEHDLVFLNRAGTPVRPEAIEKMWKYLMSKSGLPYRNFHCLRHTHATLLLANGIPIIEVSRRLGHSSVTQTLDMYGHAIPCYDKTIAEKIDAIYN